MNRGDLNRRDFHALTMAAFGGVVAGTFAGCGDAQDGKTPGAKTGETAGAPGETGETQADLAGIEWGIEKHVCRGLNACKGLGKGGDNDCAGMGTCATAVEHACHTHNECKYQGGCGEKPGQNACKGQGECAVPLMSESTWKKAREAFEAAMQKADKEFGAAPAAE